MPVYRLHYNAQFTYIMANNGISNRSHSITGGNLLKAAAKKHTLFLEHAQLHE